MCVSGVKNVIFSENFHTLNHADDPLVMVIFETLQVSLYYD